MPTFDQRKSRRQEKRAAADLGGRVQPASGAMSHAKGDVRTVGSVLAECKTTSKKAYNLKLSEWQKVQSEARGAEVPVMQIEFQGQFGQNTKLAVISWADFIHYRDDQNQF